MEATLKTGVIQKDGYLGGVAWTGVNCRGYMHYAEINKLVKKEFKKRYPNAKVSITGKSFSGGQECNAVLTCDLKTSVYTYDEFLQRIKNSGWTPIHNAWYGDKWGEMMNEDELVKASYDNYIKVIKYCSMTHLNEIDLLILKSEVVDQLRLLNNLFDSFNDVDINGMVDYFDVNFYKGVDLKAI